MRVDGYFKMGCDGKSDFRKGERDVKRGVLKGVHCIEKGSRRREQSSKLV